jgi:hypothetical protein
MRRRLQTDQRDGAAVIGDLQDHGIPVIALGDAQMRRMLDGSGLRLGLGAGDDFDAGSLPAIGEGDDAQKRTVREVAAGAAAEADNLDSYPLTLVEAREGVQKRLPLIDRNVSCMHGTSVFVPV